MTIDEFFAHVQEHGFLGLAPGKGDVLGDRWAGAVAGEFDRVAGALPPGEDRHTVWCLFQWLYCLLAGQESRVIASPPALRAAGRAVTLQQTATACRLLLATVEGGAA